ncbi:sialoadhesin-like, partial [Silurus asotus]
TNTLSVRFDNAEETVYQCCASRSRYYHNNNDYPYTRLSDSVTITATEKPKPTVKVNLQGFIQTANTIILHCELEEAKGWEFLWYKNSQVLKNEVTNTLSVRVNNAGKPVYQCRSRRLIYNNNYNNYNYYYYYTRISDSVTITARGIP